MEVFRTLNPNGAEVTSTPYGPTQTYIHDMTTHAHVHIPPQNNTSIQEKPPYMITAVVNSTK